VRMLTQLFPSHYTVLPAHSAGTRRDTLPVGLRNICRFYSGRCYNRL